MPCDEPPPGPPEGDDEFLNEFSKALAEYLRRQCRLSAVQIRKVAKLLDVDEPDDDSPDREP